MVGIGSGTTIISAVKTLGEYRITRCGTVQQ